MHAQSYCILAGQSIVGGGDSPVRCRKLSSISDPAHQKASGVPSPTVTTGSVFRGHPCPPSRTSSLTQGRLQLPVLGPRPHGPHPHLPASCSGEGTQGHPRTPQAHQPRHTHMPGPQRGSRCPFSQDASVICFWMEGWVLAWFSPFTSSLTTYWRLGVSNAPTLPRGHRLGARPKSSTSIIPEAHVYGAFWGQIGTKALHL